MRNRILNIVLLCFCMSISAQQKLDKISQSINVNDNVNIDLNTSYTNIEIDTWNKDIIEIEAYIESSVLSKEDLKKHLDNWRVDVDGSKERVIISSNSGGLSWSDQSSLFELQSLDALQDLEIELADIPVMPMVEGLLESMDLANMPKMPKLPKLPDLPEGMNAISFDFDKYEKEGEAYMDRWSSEYAEKYGEAYAKKMEAWAKSVDSKALAQYEKEMEAWGEKFGEEFGESFGKDMEKWGEEFGKKFGKSMEKWGEEFGEEFGKSMEKWGEEFGKQMEEQSKIWEEQAKVIEERYKANEESQRILFETQTSKNLNVKKTLKIKIPKKAKLNLNVRHGELKVSSLINNLKADLNHTTFLANSINGEKTSVNASYGSVFIKKWQLGSLKLKFVENALLQDVNGLVLNSNSSNIGIDKLSGNAILTGSFGDLVIHDVSDDFNNLNITLDNSNAAVKLPKVDFNLQYQGKYSRLHHPKNKESKDVTSFNLGSLSSSKTIAINARYSKVVME